MNRKRNIIGNRYGKLVVISETYDGSPVCRCDCGKIHTTSRESLLRGATRSCGCLRRTCGRPAYKGNKTGHIGIHEHKRGGYVAGITCNREFHYLGIYGDIDDAVKAREEAERVYFNPGNAEYPGQIATV